jgi:hypothetical protein
MLPELTTLEMFASDRLVDEGKRMPGIGIQLQSITH